MSRDYLKEFEKIEQSVRNEIVVLKQLNFAMRKMVTENEERVIKLEKVLGEEAGA